MEAFQTSEELAAEYAAKNLHRQEERIAGSYPAAVVLRQSGRRERRNADEDATIRTHNTLSAQDTRVQVFYPFHPLRNAVLQAVRRPKRGDGAVVVVDPAGKRLKIPI